MAPSSGQILAVAGIGLDSLQPPGSTFKMITLTGVLEAGIANPHSVFPYATYATLDGVKLHNANGEECGGSLELAFAVSCNSVFAPLGAKLGAPRLVATAERFGFNHDPGIEGAAESSLPAASAIQGELDVGSTAIGQGQVQASALEMAIVAASIADGGRRPQPAFTPGPPGTGTQATSAAVARTVRRLMTGVVRNGTGTAAAIPGVDGRRQDRHRRTEDDQQLPASSETRLEENRVSRKSLTRKAVGQPRTKRATPTPGSRRSPPHSSRGSSSACCSSKMAPAAPPRRPWRGKCSKRALGHPLTRAPPDGWIVVPGQGSKPAHRVACYARVLADADPRPIGAPPGAQAPRSSARAGGCRGESDLDLVEQQRALGWARARDRFRRGSWSCRLRRGHRGMRTGWWRRAGRGRRGCLGVAIVRLVAAGSRALEWL